MNETFGERLQRLRTSRGWTVYEAAKRAGMTPWGLSQLEHRTTVGNVQVLTLKRLARVYDVTMEYLAREVGEPEPANVA